MGKLQENELTKILIDTMDEYKESGLLEEFLTYLGIEFSEEDLKDPEFDNFAFYNLNESHRREVDGIIELDSKTIFIEAKRGNNKFDKIQLLNEFSIGNKKTEKHKRDFYLVAIDESVLEPKIIDTIRNSSYAQIKREQIKWISWYEIAKIFEQIFEKYSFDGRTSKNIFEKRLNKYKNQGFRGFEGFDKSDLNNLLKLDNFLNSLNSINTEIGNFIKAIQRDLFEDDIIRLYKSTEHWRKGRNKTRRKVKNRVNHIFWEQQSFGMGHKVGNIPYSYTFPFADTEWKSDLSKEVPDYYLYTKFDFLNGKATAGYRINKLKTIKNCITDDEALFSMIQKNRTFNYRSMMLNFKKGTFKLLDSKDVTLNHVQEIKKSTRFDFFFEYQMNDEDLFNKIKENIVFIRNIVNKFEITPKYAETEKVDKLDTENVIQEDEIVS